MELEQNTSIDNSQAWFKSVFFYLIAAILLQILVAPLLQPYIRLRILLDILSSITIIIAMFAASRNKHHIVLALILALPMIISLWANYLLVSDGVVVLGKFFGIAFLGFVIVQVSKFIYRSEAVTKDVIFAAIVVYLLMAVMWELSLLAFGAFTTRRVQYSGSSGRGSPAGFFVFQFGHDYDSGLWRHHPDNGDGHRIEYAGVPRWANLPGGRRRLAGGYARLTKIEIESPYRMTLKEYSKITIFS